MSKHQFHNNQSFILYHNRKSLLCSDSSQSSFTLVELLIVIGILAILTAAVIVVLNPADLLQQSRDSKRLQDLSSLESTINLAESIHPDIDLGTASTVYISIPDTDNDCANLGLPSLPTGYIYACVSEDNLYNTDGTGWIPINFQDTDLAGVITLSSLPTDPTNTTSTHHYYTYVTGGSYKLSATLESEKYSTNAADDGGTDYATYEKGTDLELAPFTHGLVAWWKFDGDATDSSGYNSNGVVTGTITYPSGVIGNCADFSAVGNDSVNISNGDHLDLPTAFTVAWWYKKNILSDIVWFYQSSTLLIRGVGSYIYSSQGNSGYVGSWNIQPNWNHYLVTYDKEAGIIKQYRNGSVINSLAYSNTVATNNNPFIISTATGSGTYLDGWVDDIRIYNRALSGSEVQALYNAR